MSDHEKLLAGAAPDVMAVFVVVVVPPLAFVVVVIVMVVTLCALVTAGKHAKARIAAPIMVIILFMVLFGRTRIGGGF